MESVLDEFLAFKLEKGVRGLSRIDSAAAIPYLLFGIGYEAKRQQPAAKVEERIMAGKGPEKEKCVVLLSYLGPSASVTTVTSSAICR